GRDPNGVTGGGGDCELGDGAGRGDPPDPVAVGFGEPEVAVRAGRDPKGATAGRERELGDVAGRGNPPDPVARGGFGEPRVAVRPGRDPKGGGRGAGERELVGGAGRPVDPVVLRVRDGDRLRAGGAQRDGKCVRTAVRGGEGVVVRQRGARVRAGEVDGAAVVRDCRARRGQGPDRQGEGHAGLGGGEKRGGPEE